VPCLEGPQTIYKQFKKCDDLQKFNKSDLSVVLGPFTVASDLGGYYREDFNLFDEFTAASVLPATRRIRILPMNQPITFGMKESN
jgi:hypothetical protein